MFNALAVVLFWSFASTTVTVDAAKRLYGLIGLGGVLGGLSGASLVRTFIISWGRETMLYLCVILVALIGVVGFIVLRKTGVADKPAVTRADCKIECSPSGAMSALRSSRYFLSISLIVMCYEIVSGIADFQYGSTVEQTIMEPLKRDAFFGAVGQVQSLVAIAVQLFLTSYILRRYGVKIALMVLPGAMLLGSLGFLALPTLGFATLLSVSDNSMSYTINQAARETLFVPMSRMERYTVKAFIDVVVQRFAKVLGVAVNLSIIPFRGSSALRWLSLVSLLVLLGWALLAQFTGQRFEQLATVAPSHQRDR